MTPMRIVTPFVLAAIATSLSAQDPIPVRTPTPAATPKNEVAASKEAADELARALHFLHTLPSFHMKARANLNLEDEQRPDFAFTLTMAAPNQFRVDCGDSGLLVSDGKQMLRDWFEAIHAVEAAPKSLAEWLRGEPSIHFVSITTLRGLFAPSGTVPSLLDARTVALLGEEKVGDKQALHLAVRDEKLACELWVQKGSEPWLLRYRPKWAHMDEEAHSIDFFAGDLWLEVESWSREVPKDAFALVAAKKSRRVDDLAEGVMEEQQRHIEEMEKQMEMEGDAEGGPTGDEPAPPRGEEKPHATVGKPAPDVGWTLLDGTEQKLADLKGKVVVLDFWATWCGPCVMGLPKISAVAKSYADQGVVFVACDMQEAKGGVQKFLAKKKLEIACAIVDQAFAKPFGVTGIPHTVIVGKDGVIQKVHIGFGPGQEKHFEADLREVLGLPKEEPK
ncbi:MAG: redoxin family protein, partial [Planctomycetes bacterium]|nr:redoxin family protein [Planctomycetota bacterium]